MEAKLVVVGGKANKAEVELKLPTVIGRGRDADVTVAHPTVSRHHCVLFEQDGTLFVRDNGSLNGTLIDGNKVQEAELKPGETLTVGPLTFRVDYQLPTVPNVPGPHVPATDHLAETIGSPLGSSAILSEETVQFDGGADLEAASDSGPGSKPSFGFLAEEPTDDTPVAAQPAARIDAQPAARIDSPLAMGPPATMDDEDAIDFVDDKPGLPPTVVVEPSDATIQIEPAASAETAEFALGPVAKKPAEIDEDVLAMFGDDDKTPAVEAEEFAQELAAKKPDEIDEEVLAMLGGKDEKSPAKAEAVPEIKIKGDGKPGKPPAPPAAGDDELNDFFQSLGIKE